MTTLRIRSKGTIALPPSLLKPMVSQVNELANQIAKKFREENLLLSNSSFCTQSFNVFLFFRFAADYRNRMSLLHQLLCQWFADVP